MITGSCLCGNLKWSFNATLESVTACNCSACSRYGALWAYGYEGKEIVTSGTSAAYLRDSMVLGFHFCKTCGCVGFWRSTTPDEHKQTRIAVNLRLVSEPEKVSFLPIDHFDGLHSFDDLPHDGRTVKDLWF